MSAVKVVIIDCEKAGLIGGPFQVVVVANGKRLASRSGIVTLARAEQVKVEYAAAYGLDSEDDIARAQFALDHHPQDSSYWESREGQDNLGVIVDNNLTATTSAQYAQDWHDAQMRAARVEA